MNLSCAHHGVFFVNHTAFKLSTKVFAGINLLLVLPTILINTSLIIVILMSKQRSKPCNLFLLNLVITDALSGYVAMPFNTALLYQLSEGEDPCSYSTVLLPFISILGFASFQAVFAIALDRYTAVFLPYFYIAKSHVRSTMVIIIILWLIPVVSVITATIAKAPMALTICILVTGVIGTVTNIYCYYRILRFTRRIRRDISNIAKQFEPSRYSKKESNLAITGAMILASMCCCYFPFFLVRGLLMAGFRSVAVIIALYGSVVLTMSNSLLNACITCYQLSDLRRAIKKLWGWKKGNGISVLAPANLPQRKETATVTVY